jgi:hypothetical protein
MDHIDAVVAQSMKTSINRFREKPLLFFTEADIQTYLHKDLITGNTPYLTIRDGKISLIHREYPTNFRYEKSRLLVGYSDEELAETELTNKSIRSRGHFDLVVLNPEFLSAMIAKHKRINNSMEQIINKSVYMAIDRQSDPSCKYNEEILYAIEIKYLHMFNYNHISMLDQILMDNEKLSIALRRSCGYIKPINIVFSSSKSPELIKTYLTQGKVAYPNKAEHQIKSGILNIYVEAYYDEENEKYTDKNDGALTAYCKNPKPWAIALCKNLSIKLNS